MKKINNVVLEQEYQGKIRKDGWGNHPVNHVVCTIRYNDHEEEFDYYMGIALDPVVEIFDLLDSLFMSSRTYEDSIDALDILEEGLVDNAKDARSIYEECKEISNKLISLFGEDFDEIRREVNEYVEAI